MDSMFSDTNPYSGDEKIECDLSKITVETDKLVMLDVPVGAKGNFREVKPWPKSILEKNRPDNPSPFMLTVRAPDWLIIEHFGPGGNLHGAYMDEMYIRVTDPKKIFDALMVGLECSGEITLEFHCNGTFRLKPNQIEALRKVNIQNNRCSFRHMMFTMGATNGCSNKYVVVNEDGFIMEPPEIYNTRADYQVVLTSGLLEGLASTGVQFFHLNEGNLFNYEAFVPRLLSTVVMRLPKNTFKTTKSWLALEKAIEDRQ